MHNDPGLPHLIDVQFLNAILVTFVKTMITFSLTFEHPLHNDPGLPHLIDVQFLNAILVIFVKTMITFSRLNLSIHKRSLMPWCKVSVSPYTIS